MLIYFLLPANAVWLLKCRMAANAQIAYISFIYRFVDFLKDEWLKCKERISLDPHHTAKSVYIYCQMSFSVPIVLSVVKNVWV